MENTNSVLLPGKNFTTTLVVNQSPQQVFDAINNVRGWWSDSIEGTTDRLYARFLQYYRDIHITKMKIVEFIPREKVTWHVLDSHFSFTSVENEWKDTLISFDIFSVGDKTQLLFTHQGLVPQYECYDICNDAWTELINISLRDLITTGKGHPSPGGPEAFNPMQSKRWKVSDRYI